MVRLTFAFWLAEVLGMLGSAAFPALMPGFIERWALSNTEAGLIAGLYYGGYMLGVPALSSLADRIDPRRIHMASSGLTAFAFLGFALLADGFWTALPFQILAGVGLAGTYMPGLKALTDRIEGPLQSRYVSFYTAGFAIGMGLSYFVAGAVAEALGWQWAYGAAALGALASVGVMAAAIPAAEPHHLSRHDTGLFDFRPVLRAREAMAYILGYAAHMWELFAFRGWIVAFLYYSQGLQPGGRTAWSATAIAALINILQLPASVGGNEMALRLGRRRWLIGIMTLSVALSLTVGFAAALPFALVVILATVYGFVLAADSAALTAGAVAAAPPGYRGATMAVHSTLGFGMGFLGSLAIGVVLDLAGGMSVLAWGLAFAAMGLGCAFGPAALGLLGRRAAAAA
ncbi:MAG: MFS transporter [Alphaproteobacteria bacterium]|nr:MFS transporter [Alphaproteobacteria bacterium]